MASPISGPSPQPLQPPNHSSSQAQIQELIKKMTPQLQQEVQPELLSLIQNPQNNEAVTNLGNGLATQLAKHIQAGDDAKATQIIQVGGTAIHTLQAMNLISPDQAMNITSSIKTVVQELAPPASPLHAEIVNLTPIPLGPPKGLIGGE